ncbi:hypothetical protein AB0N14_27280 [Streptomyces sp. NPDC051104]|uniref:hypothetical protein n=1 Tax=Streptomyces sp. NPDC051104 TaxID=3155044 RepID=UPI00341DEE35
MVSVSFTGLGVRAQVDGRNGREAWRLLRRRHPRLARFAVIYVAGLVGLAVWSIAQLLPRLL